VLFVSLWPTSHSARAAEIGEQIERSGDEIMVCGQLFHTTAPVVLWTDPKGYDAYRVERWFGEFEKAAWEEIVQEEKSSLNTPNRYGIRKDQLTAEQIEQVRGGGWTLPLLKDVVDQFVMHYDVCGVSQQCFKVLHDRRGLSVHFMLDIDGTIYQTLDLKERAWHATISNSRSVGVEIASIGAYPQDKQGELIPRMLPEDQWKAFQGVLGHYHVQKNKTDPGPAFDWEKVVGGAEKLLNLSK